MRLAFDCQKTHKNPQKPTKTHNFFKSQSICLSTALVPSQVANPPHVLLVLYAHPHPHVGRPRELAITFKQALRAFGKRLEVMPVCLAYYCKHPLNVIKWYRWVKQIAHGIDKNAPWFFHVSGRAAYADAFTLRQASACLGNGLALACILRKGP